MAKTASTTAKTTPTIDAWSRQGEPLGSAASRRLRKSGRIPVILYGRGAETIPLAVGQRDLVHLVRHHAHGLVQLNLSGDQQLTLIKALQWDALGESLLHADFVRVVRGETVRLEIPIKLHGEAAGIKQGGVLEQYIYEVEIECPVESIPEMIDVNVNDLKLDDAITVGQLPLPENCRLTADEDLREQVVVEVHARVEVADEPTPAVAGEAAEPEVITRKKPEGEEGEEAE